MVKRIAVNVGLWKGDPDVDAASRLSLACRAEVRQHVRAFLGEQQRTPINSQNTALSWQSIPAYYFAGEGMTEQGSRISRFGDLFSGYVLQLCAEAVGDGIAIGLPIVEQVRKAHDLLSDLSDELPGMRLSEFFADHLLEPLPRASDYPTAVRDFIDRVHKRIADASTMRDRSRYGPLRYLTKTCEVLNQWVDACERIASPGTLRVRGNS